MGSYEDVDHIRRNKNISVLSPQIAPEVLTACIHLQSDTLLVRITKLSGFQVDERLLPLGATLAQLQAFILEKRPLWTAMVFFAEDCIEPHRTDHLKHYSMLTIKGFLDASNAPKPARTFEEASFPDYILEDVGAA